MRSDTDRLSVDEVIIVPCQAERHYNVCAIHHSGGAYCGKTMGQPQRRARFVPLCGALLLGLLLTCLALYNVACVGGAVLVI
eukprot:7502418-Ditylum_brightwellii.AAC.1